MTRTPDNNPMPPELPLQPVDIASMPSEFTGGAAEAEIRYSRRGMLGLLGKGVAIAAVATTGLELTTPKTANADPDAGPVDPNDLLEQLEDLSPEERAKLLDAILNNLNANTELTELQQDELKKGPPPTPVAKQVGEIATQAVTAVGILGGLGGGWALVTRYFRGKKEERNNAEQALRIEEKAQRMREDEKFTAAVESIIEEVKRLDAITSDASLARPSSYEALALTYSKLRAFTGEARFALEIFNVTSTLLLSRAKANENRTPEQIEARMNADKETVKLLSKVAPNVPREDEEGNPILPNAAGISLEHMRQVRVPLERLSLNGAYLNGLLFTDSLAGSQFRHTRLQDTVFGEHNGLGKLRGKCDLRDADLSRAYLTGARFDNILIDEHTKFGEGLEGDPSATFGTVTSDTLTQAQINEKIAAAETVIAAWQPPDSRP